MFRYTASNWENNLRNAIIYVLYASCNIHRSLITYRTVIVYWVNAGTFYIYMTPISPWQTLPQRSNLKFKGERLWLQRLNYHCPSHFHLLCILDAASGFYEGGKTFDGRDFQLSTPVVYSTVKSTSSFAVWIVLWSSLLVIKIAINHSQMSQVKMFLSVLSVLAVNITSNVNYTTFARRWFLPIISIFLKYLHTYIDRWTQQKKNINVPKLIKSYRE